MRVDHQSIGGAVALVLSFSTNLWSQVGGEEFDASLRRIRAALNRVACWPLGADSDC
jgi:hypothetical protein